MFAEGQLVFGSHGKSAVDAVRTARERCWRYDWVLDLDVKRFFDSIDPCATSGVHTRGLRLPLLHAFFSFE